ncbi:MAG TPA: alanine--tRNA ligase [Saprospiraceae bacterium]|nr:alanine--tRNA ligase [Saprospiraceae bacterium]
MMSSREIRQAFLDFFRANAHAVVPSAPIVVKNDPTLMFTNAGMNQFKDFFLGNRIPDQTRVADTQKCLRVSGKHNDLEEVGTDGYHHTMFEMLGNWSFGDYFKEEAIALAWKLLTEVYKLDPDRLYISVFGGDEKEKLNPDTEAVNYWKKWIKEERILFFNKKDNFWEMGDTGPCGPCSEIHVDLRSDEQRSKVDGATLVNAGTPELIEIWNLVFIQYQRKANGELEELPSKHIDTGMGFERLAMVLQNKKASYDTDIFSPLIHFISSFSQIEYTSSYLPSAKSDMAMRVISDHIRAIAFTIADGSIPSNTGAGYVIRRILRRAVRYYFSYLNIKEPFLYRLIPILVDSMGSTFPELVSEQNLIVKVIQEEENSFLQTLESGLKRLDSLQMNKNSVLSGKVAFELYDTFGFPIDLTRLIASENEWTIDEEGFQSALLQQKERSRADAKKEYSDWISISDGQTKFVGYDTLELKSAKILRYREASSKGKTVYQIVLNETAFYPEGGGQVGDLGSLSVGDQLIPVINTVKENDLIIHIVEKLPTDLSAEVFIKVDGYRRSLIENNHSSTHLLHAALRKVLGNHVAQKGSLVNDQYLRFDFSHFQKISQDELKQIEELVNYKIRQNIPKQEDRAVPIEKAKQAGAMMLFGEKYGDQVRMITFDPEYSIELCGGCHVEATGDIGFFKIISESSIAAGIRRIEAMSSVAAERYIADQELELNQAKELLKNPKNIAVAIKDLQEQNKRLEKELEEMKLAQANHLAAQLESSFQSYNGINYLLAKVDLVDAKLVKTLIYQLAKSQTKSIVMLANESNGKPMIHAYVSDLLLDKINAIDLIKHCSVAIEGSGGGQKFYATAGGKKLAGIKAALEEAQAFILKQF